MRQWQHAGFSVHNRIRMKTNDAEGRKQLARYMIRNPFALEKMTYDINTGMVIYRSKFHASLKRNFQLLPAVKWLTLLLAHIPNKYESLVRYYGWYSNRAGGREMPKPVPSMPPPPCIWTRPQSIANPKLTGLGLFKRSMKSTRSNAPNATTPCASLPSSTTLLSSGPARYSQTPAPMGPHTGTTGPPRPRPTVAGQYHHPTHLSSCPGHRLSEPATTPLVSNRVYLHLILPITTVHR